MSFGVHDTLGIQVIQQIFDVAMQWYCEACASSQIVGILFVVIDHPNETMDDILDGNVLCTGIACRIIHRRCCDWVTFIDLLLMRCHARCLVTVTA